MLVYLFFETTFYNERHAGIMKLGSALIPLMDSERRGSLLKHLPKTPSATPNPKITRRCRKRILDLETTFSGFVDDVGRRCG